MTEFHTPADEAQAQDIIRAATAAGTPLEVRGGGTRAGLGRPAQAGATLSTVGLTGITLYEPSELVISARAGTPLAQLEAALDGAGQRLPFEPIDHRVLLGSTGEPTVGGLAATNASGPRRIQAGAARDSMIGVRFVNGRGEVLRSGGRVMKNVTGYDFVKLFAGAMGTLGLLTEVTFKVLPKAEQDVTLVLEGLSDGAAIEALSIALCSPFDVSGAAHLPALGGAGARTLIRIEGFHFQVDYRVAELSRLLKRFGTAGTLREGASQEVWREIRDVAPLAEPRERAIWRVSTAPSRAPQLVAALGGAVLGHIYDWGGGLVWIATDAAGDAGAAAIRTALKPLGGHATLVRGASELRAAVPPFEPQPDPLMALTRKLKQTFDPAGIFNPGRMYAGV